jgi:phosphatidylserine/phosphatidylglycerophosphate/cardiolipin synthase-like enzyme
LPETARESVGRLWACRLFSWTEKGEARGITTHWSTPQLVIGQYVTMIGVIDAAALPPEVVADIGLRVDREREFLAWVGHVSGASHQDWMDSYASTRLSNYLEIQIAVKEADIIKDELVYSVGTSGSDTGAPLPTLLFLDASDVARRQIFERLTPRQRFDQNLLALRVLADDAGRTTGVEVSASWKISGAGETIGQPEYYFEIALQYSYAAPSGTAGDLLAGRVGSDQPTTYRLFGRSAETEAGPLELDCELRFTYWNRVQKREMPLPAGIEVSALDYDAVSADDVIGRANIEGDDGRVRIQIVDKDENAPDVYFSLATAGRYIDLAANRLVDAGARRSGVEYLPLPTSWITKGRVADDGREGYFDAFDGTAIGTVSEPMTFSLMHASFFLPPIESDEYEKYVARMTRGLATPLINGRSSGGAGPDIDLNEPLIEMERVVKSLASGDTVHFSAWFFEPATVLLDGAYGAATTWGELFAAKAGEGVKIRIIINDFDPISHMDQWLQNTDLTPLNGIIQALAPAIQDNYKYIVSMQPATAGVLKTLIATSFKEWRSINVGSHHQKFMAIRRGTESIAFCGGLDIESRKTPPEWSYAGLHGWHDLHVKLEGPIAYDLERAFVSRWNREKDHSTKAKLPAWSDPESLTVPAVSAADNLPARKPHMIQMLRTVSVDAITSPYDTRRADIAEMYRRAMSGADEFIYLENQYFRSKPLADWIVARGRERPDLKVLIVVLASAAEDDGVNAVTAHGDHLQFETLGAIVRGVGAARSRIYTMKDRSVHAKFALIDDVWMTIGSANANERSFRLDSELNVSIVDPPLVESFRHRLWAHNLGVPEATVAGWARSDFFTQWDAVATTNAALPDDQMAGEGIIPFDYASVPGQGNSLIPDALADLDLAPDGRLLAGDAPEGRVVMRGVTGTGVA